MRANILCAGFGTRLRPFTYLKPKPLLNIGGYPLVERTIRQLHADGVTDIALVVGYKHECFNYLVDKYGVQLIISAQYATANNYSSLQLVAHRLGDSLVIDGDTYIRRPVVPLVRPGVSQFICQQTQQGHEWELITDADDRVVSVRKDSPSGYCMSGVSYWTEEAAALIREELDRSGPDDYWEDSVIRILDRVPVYATRVKMLLCEIDSLSDALSLGLLTPDELADQCSGRVVVDESTCSNVHVINETGFPMVVAGLSDAVVVATPDGILVSGKEASKSIKAQVAEAAESRPMYEQRRWGEYRVIDSSVFPDGAKALTKEMIVRDGKQLSYQRHAHRSEVWAVVSGTGEVVLDGLVRQVRAGSVVQIPAQTMHAGRAVGSDMHIIEVQQGDILVEEDIERFGDFWK